MTLDVVYLQWCQRFESSKSIGSQGSDFIVAQVTAKKIKINYDLTLCLKITEKVAFNIASEASYVYILSGQKFIKNAKNRQFGEFLESL